MKKAQDTTSKKGDPAAKTPSGESSRQPPAQATFPVLDICSEWGAPTVPKTTVVSNPEEEAFIKELEEKFGSKEEAMKLFSRFSAFRQQPQTILDESTVQPPSSQPEGSQTLDLAHTETGPTPDIEEHGQSGGRMEEESVSGFADEIDRMVVEHSMDEAARGGNTSTLQSMGGGNPCC